MRAPNEGLKISREFVHAQRHLPPFEWFAATGVRRFGQ